jgi:hypothetical protein
MPNNDYTTQRTFDSLGTLLLSSDRDVQFHDEVTYLSTFSREQFHDLLKQAEKQRVLRRTLIALRANLPDSARDIVAECDVLLAREQERVNAALACLQEILVRFDRKGLAVTAMKTLDHWPDTGSDLDLLVDASDSQVCQIFETELKAQRQAQSWGDRLAHKFNFRVPGLGELVEVHVGCLGQTGEQKALALGVLSRCTRQDYSGYSIPVPAMEDRIVIAALQRMYRHYYIRLTDIVNIFRLLQEKRIDFQGLESIASAASVWLGVATLVSVVAQHAQRYGGEAVLLPKAVEKTARFDSTSTYLDRNFVRVPLMPEATDLYLHQLAGNGRNHNFAAVARLSLLPVLATAAFVSFRLTGDDKGVW